MGAENFAHLEVGKVAGDRVAVHLVNPFFFLELPSQCFVEQADFLLEVCKP